MAVGLVVAAMCGRRRQSPGLPVESDLTNPDDPGAPTA